MSPAHLSPILAVRNAIRSVAARVRDALDVRPVCSLDSEVLTDGIERELLQREMRPWSRVR